MAVICEQCGGSYQPTAESPQCPRCYRAEKGASSTRSAVAAQPSAQRRAVPKSSSPQGGAKPAPRSVGPAPAAQAPARTSAARRAHHAPREKPVLDDVTRYGLFATLGFGLLVGIVCFFVFRSKAAARRKHEAFQAEVTQIYKDLQALNLSDPVAAERIIQLASDKENTWKHHDLAADIESLVARARNNLTTAKEKSAAMERFTQIEAELAKGDLTSERLKELRRQLDESEARLADGGADLLARFSLTRTKAQQVYATVLAKEARDGAIDGATPRASLVRYQSVEDEIKTLLDRAYTAKDKEQQDFYTAIYKQVISESDALAKSLFQAEGDSLDWVDCLTPPQSGYWNASSAKGFSHKVEGGALLLVGPDADAGRMAVISIGDREQWRHFQADFDFILEKGEIDLFLRLGKGPNQNTLSYPLRTRESTGGILIPGRKYSARISVIGSRLLVNFAGEDIDTPGATDQEIPWTYTRKGAIGFVVSPQARAKITRLRVRELR
jgi:hypothetical protein